MATVVARCLSAKVRRQRGIYIRPSHNYCKKIMEEFALAFLMKVAARYRTFKSTPNYFWVKFSERVGGAGASSCCSRPFFNFAGEYASDIADLNWSDKVASTWIRVESHEEEKGREHDKFLKAIKIKSSPFVTYFSNSTRDDATRRVRRKGAGKCMNVNNRLLLLFLAFPTSYFLFRFSCDSFLKPHFRSVPLLPLPQKNS